jgi:hypothetical protein
MLDSIHIELNFFYLLRYELMELIYNIDKICVAENAGPVSSSELNNDISIRLVSSEDSVHHDSEDRVNSSSVD